MVPTNVLEKTNFQTGFRPINKTDVPSTVTVFHGMYLKNFLLSIHIGALKLGGFEDVTKMNDSISFETSRNPIPGTQQVEVNG